MMSLLWSIHLFVTNTKFQILTVVDGNLSLFWITWLLQIFKHWPKIKQKKTKSFYQDFNQVNEKIQIPVLLIENLEIHSMQPQ